MNQVLVIGASNAIGRRVVSALLGCDWANPIAAIDRSPFMNDPSIRQVGIDAADFASVSDALRGVDAVVNCLVGRPSSIAAGASALFAAAARMRPPPLIVHLSSMSVYGSVSGDVSEDAPLRADLGPYSRAKLHAESLAADYPRSAILRPGCEYGPDCDLWSGRIARWLYAYRMGDLGPAGDGYCNLVYVDDLVEGILSSLRRPEAAGGAFNLVMSDPPTWNEYFVLFARALGAVPAKRISRRQLAFETRILAVPLKTFEIAARSFGQFSPPPPIPPSLLKLTAQDIRLVNARAQRILGWTCKPLDEGLREAAEWFNRKRRRDCTAFAAGRNLSSAEPS